MTYVVFFCNKSTYNVTRGEKMELLLAAICGMTVSYMNILNGQLSAVTGSFLSLVVIHLTGLIAVILMLAIKKEKLTFKAGIPLFAYSGGIVGVLTTLFSVVAVSKVGAASLTALSLGGQMAISFLLEQNRWLGARKQAMTLPKFAGLCVVILGIGVMFS